MNPNHDHYPEGEALRRSTQHTLSHCIHLAGVILLRVIDRHDQPAALLYNVVDGAFGYVAYEYKNDPSEFTTKPLDDLNKQELLDILKANLSSGAYKKLDNEKPMEKRSKADLYTLVLERLVQIDTKQTWSMTDSIFAVQRSKPKLRRNIQKRCSNSARGLRQYSLPLPCPPKQSLRACAQPSLAHCGWWELPFYLPCPLARARQSIFKNMPAKISSTVSFKPISIILRACQALSMGCWGWRSLSARWNHLPAEACSGSPIRTGAPFYLLD